MNIPWVISPKAINCVPCLPKDGFVSCTDSRHFKGPMYLFPGSKSIFQGKFYRLEWHMQFFIACNLGCILMHLFIIIVHRSMLDDPVIGRCPRIWDEE